MNRFAAALIALASIVGVYLALRAVVKRFADYRVPDRRFVLHTAPVGVGGWLALFILCLVFGNAWMAIYSFAREAEIIRAHSSEFPGLLTMQAASLTHVFAGSLFSAVAGIYLYREVFRGYILAREFLLFSLAGVICSLGVPLFSGMDSDAILTMVLHQLSHSAPQSILYFVIWWLYLSRSDRVYRTYIEPLHTGAPPAQSPTDQSTSSPPTERLRFP